MGDFDFSMTVLAVLFSITLLGIDFSMFATLLDGVVVGFLFSDEVLFAGVLSVFLSAGPGLVFDGFDGVCFSFVIWFKN